MCVIGRAVTEERNHSTPMHTIPKSSFLAGSRHVLAAAFVVCLLGLAAPVHALVTTFGPGNQVATGFNGTLFNVNSNLAWIDTRFTALNSGTLDTFNFGSNTSTGYANNDPTAFFVDIYADDGSGGLGAFLGTSTSVAFNNGGSATRSASFAGINVTSGQIYHAVVKSNTANGSNTFNVGIGQPGAAAKKVESYNMTTPNAGFTTRTSTDGGANWTTIGSNGITQHSAVISGATQGYVYSGFTDNGRIFNNGTSQQALSQFFNFDIENTTGELSSISLALRANTTGVRDVFFRIANASDFSLLAEKTISFDFTNTSGFFNVSADFTGISLLDGGDYILFVGQSNNNGSTNAGGYLFTRAFQTDFAALNAQSFGGSASYAGITSSLTSLGTSLNATRADYPFTIVYDAVPEPAAAGLFALGGLALIIGKRNRSSALRRA